MTTLLAAPATFGANEVTEATAATASQENLTTAAVVGQATEDDGSSEIYNDEPVLNDVVDYWTQRAELMSAIPWLFYAYKPNCTLNSQASDIGRHPPQQV